MKMASLKLSIQDKKDLDKFTKFLALKAAQIIVQSRLGDKVQTKCKPHSSGTDWFNLAIQDMPEILTEAKKALCGEVVTSRLPLCVEISLKTIEGDTMMLETWCLGVLPEQCDPSIRVTYTVYNRMGILLKSLVSVTRVTPAYKLSRRQGPDSYGICYRIYLGEPQLHTLGEGYKQVRIGQICTPVGTIHMSVSYRTKMTISPQHTGRDTSIMLKSDHFHPDLSPRHARYKQSEENSASLSETIKVGAFADSCRPPPLPLDPDLDNINVPFSNLLTSRIKTPPQQSPLQAPAHIPGSYHTSPGNLCQATENAEDEGNGNVTPRCSSAADSRRSSCSMLSANDDFIMVDLKTPFAGGNTNSELSTFYRECQTAPQLKIFTEDQSDVTQVEDITKTLENFELNIKEYDEMLNTLCMNDNNN